MSHEMMDSSSVDIGEHERVAPAAGQLEFLVVEHGRPEDSRSHRPTCARRNRTNRENAFVVVNCFSPHMKLARYDSRCSPGQGEVQKYPAPTAKSSPCVRRAIIMTIRVCFPPNGNVHRGAIDWVGCPTTNVSSRAPGPSNFLFALSLRDSPFSTLISLLMGDSPHRRKLPQQGKDIHACTGIAPRKRKIRSDVGRHCRTVPTTRIGKFCVLRIGRLYLL
jgi:hypothetical protein